MKVNNVYGIICLVIIPLLANHAWAADWKLFASSAGGNIYYDQKSLKKENKSIVHVWTKKTYSEQGKLREFSLLKKIGKAPGNPYILSHELTLIDMDCMNKKIKISSNRICDKRGHFVASITRSSDEWNNIVRKSSDEELKNIVCSAGETTGKKQK
ncbi:MAG TPA: surface-adhesin E family protein [Smithella sp.]|nr:surface-adhesin E family protein [Smithella sp.]